MYSPRWHGLTTVKELAHLNLIPSEDYSAICSAAHLFPVRVSRHLTRLMDQSTSTCPIKSQFVPSVHELRHSGESFTEDPLHEARYVKVPGVLHRYPDRVLLHVSSVCAANCRFCFRRSIVQCRETCLQGGNWSSTLEYVSHHLQIREVILSGGDPLMLADPVLKSLLQDLSRIPHLDSVRIHTRVPVVLPERMTAPLADILLTCRKPLRLVLHVNHPKEIGEAMLTSIEPLGNGDVPLLSQTVLLRGINDDPQTLENLFRLLSGHGVQPYYLHHPDRATGTSHFYVSLEDGLSIYRRLKTCAGKDRLPNYVIDHPVVQRKIPVESLGVPLLERPGDFLS